ncbi:MAG: helix-turn-helix transcriptional regulator [Christensenella sp.]|uniref:helix-turn-helix domain-containing protein n=1 Tax=Christensenella sp. TaxID=1935934 RepID=UPI002B21BE41|nr:helix-turn-helix transcriptional regulator [Christensenella sp.]MEA5002460.1 helix-turn-helix transcriptional regulator [Christensenella sp.]
MDKKTMGSFICVLRKASGMTQQELADRLHVSNKTVSRWERDESSPELALIPVIAELFSVTTDELLRGQKNPAANDETFAHAQQQISYLIKNSVSKYRMRTLLAAFISVSALISMVIFGFGLRAPVVGIGLAVVLIAASLILQADCLSTLRLALGGTESGRKDVSVSLYRSWQMFFVVCYLNIFVLFCVLPFMTGYQSIDSIMPRNTWLFFLPLYLFFALVVCLVFSFFVPVIISHKDELGDAYKHAEKRNARLRLVCIGICAAALIGCGALQTNLHTSISDIASGKTFTSFEDFKEYAEMPISVDSDGRRVDVNDEETGEIIRHYEERDKDLWHDTSLTDAAGKDYPFTWRNQDASLFDYNEDLSRVTVYSRVDQIAYNHYVETIELLFLLAYIAIIAAAVVLYLKKRIRIGAIL